MSHREISRIWNAATILASFVWQGYIISWYCIRLQAVIFGEMELHNWFQNHVICGTIGRLFVENCYINLPLKFELYSWWRHQMETFSASLALCAGNSPVPVNSPHKGQWRGALMFSLICASINDWVNNREAGDVRRHRGHYDIVMWLFSTLHHVENMFIMTNCIMQ